MQKKAKVLALALGLLVALFILSRFFRLPFLGVHPHGAIPAETALFFTLNTEQLKAISAGGAPRLLQEIFFPNSLKEDLLTYEALFGKKLPMPAGQDLLVTAHPARGSGIDLLFILPDCRGVNLETALRPEKGQQVRTSVFLNQAVFTVVNGSRTFSFSKYRNLLLAARHAYLVENAISQLKSPNSAICRQDGFQQIAMAGSEDKFHIFLNVSELGAQFAPLIEPSELEKIAGLGSVGQWLRFDFTNEKDLSEWSATLAPAPENALLDACRGSDEKDFKAAFQSLPNSLTAFAWLALDGFQPAANGKVWKEYFRPWAGDEAIIAAGEQTSGSSSELFLLLKTSDTKLAEGALKKFAAQKEGAAGGHDVQMYHVEQVPGGELSVVFGLPEFPDASYATVLGEFAIFSNSKAGLDRWIGQYLAGQTFAKDVPFLQSLRPLPSEANSFFYLESSQAWQQIGLLLSEKQLASFSQNPLRFRHLAATGTWEGGQLNIQGATPAAAAAAEKEGPASVLWNIPLLGNAVGRPLLSLNNATGETEVLVRDDVQNVYLLSRSGRIIWQRKMDEPILSDFTVIDLQNDRDRQFVFNTPSAIHVLDQKGGEAAGFPLPLQVPATNGVTVIDFFDSRDYHFFIACENGNAYGFDERGSPVEGWRPNLKTGAVKCPLLHFQTEGKDFLALLNEEGQLQVFRKDGSPRFPKVKLESTTLQRLGYQASKTNSRIVACDEKGKVHVINTKGELFNLSLNFGKKDGVKFDFADVLGDDAKDYIGFAGKELKVFFYEGEAFKNGLNHAFPWEQDEVFEVVWEGRKKRYIGTYSVSKKRIFLLEGSGKIPDAFPLEGTTPFIVADLLGDGRPVVVTGNGRNVSAYAF